jgi:hypothetical protein
MQVSVVSFSGVFFSSLVGLAAFFRSFGGLLLVLCTLAILAFGTADKSVSALRLEAGIRSYDDVGTTALTAAPADKADN